MQVPCYPERKIAEIKVRIDRLQGEYKAFLRKLRDLDPNMKETPWEDRPYSDRKRRSGATTEIDDTQHGNLRVKHFQFPTWVGGRFSIYISCPNFQIFSNSYILQIKQDKTNKIDQILSKI